VLAWSAAARAVDGGRLVARLAELAAIGADQNGGITRIAYSDADRKALDLVASWMESAGLTVTFDRYGNMFGSTDANAPDADVSVSGSHIDTVPNGGRLDGAYGVVAAVEACSAVQQAASPKRAMEAVVWRCEEPARFAQGKVGSFLFAGKLGESSLQPVGPEPMSLADLLRAEPSRPRRAGNRRIKTAIELHIEQGRRLEDEGIRLGIVTAVAAPVRLRLSVHGRTDHSGATPMHLRQDALAASAELILAVEQAARARSAAGTVATVASIEAHPGAINVIPGEASMLTDIRGVDAGSMAEVVAEVRAAASGIASRRGVTISVDELSRGIPTVFPDAMVDACEAAAGVLEVPTLRLPSGAGHDIQALADDADTCMLFAPSCGGVSHAPEEATAEQDLILGARALAAAWLAVADR
jgi:beta-ureidopropionase / N-carbamoyl-L-amino-acid hydrolase